MIKMPAPDSSQVTPSDRISESDPVAVSKVFVLDTNVILHDARCIWKFEDNDLAIPITVLEELDRFKKGNEDINFQARQFLRTLDELTGDVISGQGADLGEGLGRIRVVLGTELKDSLKQILSHDSPDHRILSNALEVKEAEAPRSVVLISKDTNLRMKAKAVGLTAQDYINDKVESFDKLYTGKRLVEGVASETVDQFYAGDGAVAANEDMLPISDPIANENFIIRNGSKSVLATYGSEIGCYHRVEKHSTYGITPRNAEQAFAMKALLNDNIKLVTLAGKAGSGKTLLALASALEQRQQYRQILLARPIVPLSNRDIGYLPGDVSAKLDPYMQPLFDNLTVIRHEVGNTDAADKIQELLEAKKLEITPLAYIRGRSLQRIFFIVDEAQNLTPHEVKTIITRAGEGTKIIFTGDIHQIDHPYLDALSNGFSYLINRMVGQPLYAHVTLEKGERSPLAELASDLL
ncbi:PhoH family protein [Rubinisphaera sp. JC750]|uniref:PhoH family protein n=1 Tax=Rubinisphaera sp. JC750 TaxID=2898658 RepID=UPI001F004F81|nr:PhoH family protein [Rubinisphaera sp. JC750]